MKYTLFPLFILLSFSLTVACGKTGTAQQTLKISSCDGSSCDNPDDGSFVVKVQKTEGIISQRQLLENYKSCLKIPGSAVSATTKNAYNESISSLSQDGLIKDLNAPLMMAVAKVASELCLDLVNNVEKSSTNRTFFPGFTLSGVPATDNAQTFDIKKTLIAFSSSCWGRAITDTEMTFITSKLTAGAKDKATAIFACTAVLSSAEAVRF